MNAKSTSENGAGMTFVLPGAMTIETIEALAAECKQWPLAEKTTLTLDASKVESITTPGIQLILSLEKALAAQGGALIVRGKKEPLIHAFRDAGVESALGKEA